MHGNQVSELNPKTTLPDQPAHGAPTASTASYRTETLETSRRSRWRRSGLLRPARGPASRERGAEGQPQDARRTSAREPPLTDSGQHQSSPGSRCRTALRRSKLRAAPEGALLEQSVARPAPARPGGAFRVGCASGASGQRLPRSGGDPPCPIPRPVPRLGPAAPRGGAVSAAGAAGGGRERRGRRRQRRGQPRRGLSTLPAGGEAGAERGRRHGGAGRGAAADGAGRGGAGRAGRSGGRGRGAARGLRAPLTSRRPLAGGARRRPVGQTALLRLGPRGGAGVRDTLRPQR